jgi:SAM-dependent methyltransferase
LHKTRKAVSRQVGLEIGHICGKYFLKLDHLHYGYWTDHISLDVANLHLAQEQYARFVISHIPDGVKTILDIGCGTGHIAKHLIDMGYKVDCVCPDPYLRERAGELLRDKSRIFGCPYEELETENRYDMALFCESFQYIDEIKAISNSDKILSDGGYMLICDIFRKTVGNESTMSGGHNLDRFYDRIAEVPFQKIEDLDITEQTAPNMDLMDDVMQNVVKPSAEAALRFFQCRNPHILKFLRWKYRKKFEKVERKYFSGERTGETFKKYKSYRLMLYKKVAERAG